MIIDKYVNLHKSVGEKLNLYLVMRYVLASVLGALGMLGLSYLWHGVLLNDFAKITLPAPVFFSLLGVVYLGISVVLSIVFDHFYKQINYLSICSDKNVFQW